MAQCDGREHAGIDVAAREQDDGRAARRGHDRAGEQRGDPDRAGSLDDQLGALEQHHHRLGDVVLADDDELVDPRLHERQHQSAGTLDRDPVGERRAATDLDRLAALERGHIGRAALDLHADHAYAGPRGLEHARDATDQPAAADRHDHGRDVLDVVEQLEPDRALAGDDLRVVERMHERRTGLGRPFAGARHAGVDGVAAEPDGSAEALDRGHLRQRCLGRHEDLAAEPTCARGVRQRLRVVAGAARHDRTAPARIAAAAAWADSARPPAAAASRSTLASAPRSLNEPVRCRFSALSSTVPPHSSDRLREVRTGVWRTRSRVRSRASRTASMPSQPSRAGVRAAMILIYQG